MTVVRWSARRAGAARATADREEELEGRGPAGRMKQQYLGDPCGGGGDPQPPRAFLLSSSAIRRPGRRSCGGRQQRTRSSAIACLLSAWAWCGVRCSPAPFAPLLLLPPLAPTAGRRRRC